MSVNGKRDQFSRADLEAVGRNAQLKRGRAETIAEEVITAVRAWPSFAADGGVPEATWSEIQSSHRLNLLDL
jgi:serine/threonine-protein kinase HipA